jgi:hypothetical protein
VIDPAGFPVEADRLAAELEADFTLDGVARVQQALDRKRTEALVVAAGCFVGEVLRRLVGGTWQADGTLVGVGDVAMTAPLAKARAGEDLVTYTRQVVEWAGDKRREPAEKGF